MTKSYPASRREKRRRAKERATKSSALNLDAEIKALQRLPDEQIDTSDIPEITDWSNAVVGKFYRPLKQPVTIRLDADVIAWFKATGPGYQTRINALLRRAMHPPAGYKRSKKR